jgi:hypothetical protein
MFVRKLIGRYAYRISMSLFAKLDVDVLFGSDELIKPEVDDKDMVVRVIRNQNVLRLQIVVIYPLLSSVLYG